MTTDGFFEFERDFVESLRCIPMQVRYKLDTCGIKLKLHQWNQFELGDRAALTHRPCTTLEEIADYRSFLTRLIRDRAGEKAKDLAIDSHPPWHQTEIPESVRAKASEFGIDLGDRQWESLSPLQRFALLKLSRSGHENSNFLPALKEFGLA